MNVLHFISNATRPAWAGFKTAEEGRAKIMKFSIVMYSDGITTVLNSYLIQIINKKLNFRNIAQKQIPPLEWVDPVGPGVR